MQTLKQFSDKPETIPASTAWYIADLAEACGRQKLKKRGTAPIFRFTSQPTLTRPKKIGRCPYL